MGLFRKTFRGGIIYSELLRIPGGLGGVGNRERIVFQEKKNTSVKEPKCEEACSVLGTKGSEHR